MTNLNLSPSKYSIQFAILGTFEINWLIHTDVFGAQWPAFSTQ